MPPEIARPKPGGKTKPRLSEPERDQRRLLNTALDEVAAPDHPVRQVWRFGAVPCEIETRKDGSDRLGSGVKRRCDPGDS
jgi:hypothetical protein